MSLSDAESVRSCLLARTSSGTLASIYFWIWGGLHLKLYLIILKLLRTWTCHGCRRRRVWRWCWGSTFPSTAYDIWKKTWWNSVLLDPILETADFYSWRLPYWIRWLYEVRGYWVRFVWFSWDAVCLYVRMCYWGWWFFLSYRVLWWWFWFIFCSTICWTLCRRRTPFYQMMILI